MSATSGESPASEDGFWQEQEFDEQAPPSTPKIIVGDGCIPINENHRRLIEWRMTIGRVTWPTIDKSAPVAIPPRIRGHVAIPETPTPALEDPLNSAFFPPAKGEGVSTSKMFGDYTFSQLAQLSEAGRQHMWPTWAAHGGFDAIKKFVNNKTWSMEEEIALTGELSIQGIYCAVNKATGQPASWTPWSAGCPLNWLREFNEQLAVHHDHHDPNSHPERTRRLDLNGDMAGILPWEINVVEGKVLRYHAFVMDHIKGSWRAGYRSKIWVGDVWEPHSPREEEVQETNQDMEVAVGEAQYNIAEEPRWDV